MQRNILFFIKTLVTVAGINFFTPQAIPRASYANAQEVEPCYMIDSTGVVTNLSQLCTQYQ